MYFFLGIFSQANILADTLTIQQARLVPYGTIVTVGGRVTVGNEFAGPSYFQDATGGMAVFSTPLSSAVKIGDSILVTGSVTDYGADTTKPRGSGLTEISGGTITFTILPIIGRVPEIQNVAVSDIGESLEGQLIAVHNVVILGATGKPRTFLGNTNYKILDGNDTTEIRIGKSTNIVGATIPEGNIPFIIGVLGEYKNFYQLSPRFVDDLGIQKNNNPGDTVAKTKTLDITTWNLKWFGDPADGGPVDDTLQMHNVARVLDSLDSDIYSLQEVVNVALFKRILDSLPRYGGIINTDIKQSQRTAFIFKKSVIDTLKTEAVMKNSPSQAWGSGRYPFHLDCNATVQGVTQRIHVFDIHAKATLASTQATDYQRRTDDAASLFTFLNNIYANVNVVVAGDFNDDIPISVYKKSGVAQPSPYKIFTDDSLHYTAITKSLSLRGFVSQSTSMIDHILVSNTLKPMIFGGAEKVENPSYIGSYTYTTTDHYPVTVRFFLKGTSDVAEGDLQQIQTSEFSIFPNPISASGNVSFSLNSPASVKITLVNVLGQEIRTIYEAPQEIGTHSVEFSTQEIPQGVYFCHFQVGGIVQTLKISITH